MSAAEFGIFELSLATPAAWFIVRYDIQWYSCHFGQSVFYGTAAIARRQIASRYATHVAEAGACTRRLVYCTVYIWANGHDMFIVRLQADQWGVNPCGEGGEYETLTLDAPEALFMHQVIM